MARVGEHGPVAVRRARAGDLRRLGDLEASGAEQFREHFGPDLNPVLLSTPPSGARRAEQPGFLLVAAPGDGDPVGFVHVLDLDGRAHLEQLSVRPQAQRRGVGSRLVRAAMAEARALGYAALSLCTFAHVPWNAPFYAGLGFREVTDLAPYQRRLVEHERLVGLDADGVRVVMQVPLRAPRAGG